MAIEVKIPPMGESITSGILAKWNVKNGDVVKVEFEGEITHSWKVLQSKKPERPTT